MTQVTRRTEPAPVYPPGWLVGQLPVGMRDDDLLVRFTTIFERLGTTLRAGADGIEHATDTTITTPGMLRYLGNWLGYDLLDPGLPIAQQRRLIAALGFALPRRGTAVGLKVLLEAMTDAPVRIDEPGAVVRAGRAPEVCGEVVVHVRGTGHLRAHELESLIRDEVPAHLGVRVVDVSDVPVAPAARAEVPGDIDLDDVAEPRVDAEAPTSDTPSVRTAAGAPPPPPPPPPGPPPPPAPPQDGDTAAQETP